MFRTLKAATLAATCAMIMAPAAFAQEAKIPAFDQNELTVLDRQGSCVLTKWDGTGAECGSEAAALWRTIYFGFDSAALSKESKAKLDRLYSKLTAESGSILRANIVGYTDEIGSSDYNYKLSQRRAAAVHKYLQSLGYKDSNVTEIRALGERSSAGKCPTKLKRKDRIACLWEDRRVEIELDYAATKGKRIVR